jgi:hypothetical protein
MSMPETSVSGWTQTTGEATAPSLGTDVFVANTPGARVAASLSYIRKETRRLPTAVTTAGKSLTSLARPRQRRRRKNGRRRREMTRPLRKWSDSRGKYGGDSVAVGGAMTRATGRDAMVDEQKAGTSGLEPFFDVRRDAEPGSKATAHVPKVSGRGRESSAVEHVETVEGTMERVERRSTSLTVVG